MHQTQLAATALDESPNDNISVPYGLIRTVRHYLEFVGLLRYIRGLKTKGIKLDSIVLALAVFTMHASNSMNACSSWLANPRVKRQLGFSEKDQISQKTINSSTPRFITMSRCRTDHPSGGSGPAGGNLPGFMG